LTEIYDNIDKIKKYQLIQPKIKFITDNMICDLKIHALYYKNAIKRPIEFKRAMKGTEEIDWTLCNYWDVEQIRELLKCSSKNILTGIGELTYDLENLIKKIKFTPQEKTILNLWRENNTTQEDIAKDLNISQSFVSQSLDNICNKICDTYNEQFEDWLNLNWTKGQYKKCSKCNKIKLISKFGKHPNTKDGLYPSCKSCRNE